MSTTITLPIDIELKSLLTKKAAAQGINVEQYAVNTLRRLAARPTISEVFADVQAEFAGERNDG